MFTKEKDKDWDYVLIDEDKRTHSNGTKYSYRLWEDRNAHGKPVTIVNEDYNNYGPQLDDQTASKIGKEIGEQRHYPPSAMELYRQDVRGKLYGFDTYKYDVSHVPDMTDTSEGDKSRGRLTGESYSSQGRTVPDAERDALDLAGIDTRDPSDINRLERPMEFDREQSKRELESPSHEPGIDRDDDIDR